MFESVMTYALNPLFWGVFGVVLACFEILIPGVYLLWLGAGSLLTAGVLFLFPQLSLTWILITLGGSSVIFMIMGSFLYHQYFWHQKGDETLNRRGENLIGQTFILDEDMVHGKGRVRIGDSYWTIKGKDAKAGASFTVERVEGNTLCVVLKN